MTGNWSFLGLHGRNFGRGPVASAPAPSARNNSARFGFGQGENGASGPLRLINQQLGGEAGWLLPLALIGIVAAGWQLRPRFPLEDRHRSILFWSVWLLAGAGFFSVAGFFHSYYLVMIAPPIAALGGAGLAWMWHDYRGTSWRGWLLPFSLIAVSLVQRHILRYYTSWHSWISTSIVPVAAGVALLLILLRIFRLFSPNRIGLKFDHLATSAGVVLLAAGAVSIGLAPSAWAMETSLHDAGGLLPTAGPVTRGGRGGFAFQTNSRFDIPGLPNVVAPGNFGNQVDPLTLEFLLKNQGNTKFLVGTLNATSAAPIILATGKPVMALGGFTGSDPILSITDLQNLIANGTVRFFMLQAGFGGGRGFTPPNAQGGDNGGPFDFGVGREPGQFPRGQIGQPPIGGTQRPGNAVEPAQGGVSGQGLSAWITSNCLPVSPTSINGTQIGLNRAVELYDCAP